jgi:hypothetical protein
MFVTEGCSRFEHQLDPDRTLWRTFEVLTRSRVFVARTAPGIVNGPRTLFISTADGLADAISEERYGSVQQLCLIDCLAGSDLRDWRLQPVAQVRRHVVAILGGGDALEAVLQSGETITIVPPLSRRVHQRTEVIWEWEQDGAGGRMVEPP